MKIANEMDVLIAAMTLRNERKNKMTDVNTIMINDEKYIRESDAAAKTLDGMSYAIIRSREQGVMCGYVESINGRTVALRQARQIYHYDSTFVLPDLAEHGPRDKEKMKMSVAMSQPCLMLEACGVLYCTSKAAKALTEIEAVKK